MSISLDTVTTNTTGGYLGHYPARPVWGYLATTNGSQPSSSNMFYLTFSAKNPTVPMTCDYGHAGSQGNVGAPRAFTADEPSSSQYYAASTSQTTSESWSPTSSYVGSPYLHQTGSYVAFDAFDNGHYYFGQRAGSTNTNKQFSGIVIGEARWNQTYDLLAFNGKITKRPIKSLISSTNWQTASVDQDFFFVSQQMWSGSSYGSPSGQSLGLGYATPGVTTSTETSNDTSYAFRNYGMICHNRNTGRVAYLENRNNTTASYRLHRLDLQLKISKKTTTKEIFDAWDAAVDAGSSRYTSHDFTLPSWSNSYTTDFCSQQIKVILCDDNSMWLIGWDHSNGSSGTLRLYRNTTAGVYTSWTQVSTISTTTTYNGAQGQQYGISHFNSDDNSRVAVFVPYYYYHGGICSFVVSTQTSTPSGTGNEDVHWMQITNQDSNGGYFIVPAGGANFVYHRTYQNSDGGTGAQFRIVNTRILRGQTVSWNSDLNYYPTINQSTSYHSWVPIKIQPTLEFKPDDEPWT